MSSEPGSCVCTKPAASSDEYLIGLIVDHVPRLVEDGFRVFRVEGLYETSVYRSEIGAIYREALTLAFAGGSFALEDRWADAARRHAPRGLCNGYSFGTAGRAYVGTVLQDANSEV